MTEAAVEDSLSAARRFWMKIWHRDDVRFIAHCLFLLALLIWLRPVFQRNLPNALYEESSILWAVVKHDWRLILESAQGKRPPSSGLLFLLIPTALLLVGRFPRTWTQWEHGKALRGLVMALLAILAWAGSTFEYNMYLDRLHLLDRALLIVLFLLSWRSPLVVPFAVRWAWVMLREPFVPIVLDDFDFRSVHELTVIFSVYVWLSFIRSYRPAHFLLVAIGCWASYYYAAGVAKLFYGPTWSWLFEDRLSNLAFGSYVRGWLSFIPEETFLALNDFEGQLNPVLRWFTMAFELGALAAYFLHRRLAQLWFLLGFVFQFGIFLMTGICFWKWMFTNIAFLVFVSTSGAPIYRNMTRSWLVIGFAVLVVFFSRERIYYNPQTGVAWYDSRLVENYTMRAIGESGAAYLVPPRFLQPMDMHFAQGALCYATNEPTVTSIYGVTGNYGAMLALEEMSRPEDALAIAERGGRCNDPAGRKVFDDFMQRYFRSVNRHGSRPMAWLAWLGRPRHLWVFPKGRLYDFQEPVTRIELWRELVVKFEGRVYRFDRRRVRTVDVVKPQGNTAAE